MRATTVHENGQPAGHEKKSLLSLRDVWVNELANYPFVNLIGFGVLIEFEPSPLLFSRPSRYQHLRRPATTLIYPVNDIFWQRKTWMQMSEHLRGTAS